jgi:arylsulfatase A-like enzyme
MLRSVLLATALGCFSLNSLQAADSRPPNVVIIFADDLGYGDLGCYGHPTIRTPELDRMAAEGMKFTQFYSAAPVCTPSRAALMTGRLPIRTGMTSDKRVVLFPDSPGGLPPEEVTLAEALKERGYATGAIGKWHLGHLPQYLPTRNGFDEYFGLPYSNDMYSKQRGDPPVPLMRGEEIIEQPVVQETLTRRYTEEAVKFIEQHRGGPFFLYIAHTFPHIPLFASDSFRGKSARGLYGDTVEELDWSVGQVLKTLRNLKLAEDTFVFFTSDNGPWLTQHLQGGSAGLLREGKGSTWEGGMREPAIAWQPGRIPAGVTTQELGSTMDLYVTAIRMAGGEPPADRPIDGYDLRPVLYRTGPSPRQEMFFYRGIRLMAVRQGPWKAHFITQPSLGAGKAETHEPPLLFHLGHDPSEQYNVADKQPEVVKRLQELAADHKAHVVPGKPQLDDTLPKPK